MKILRHLLLLLTLVLGLLFADGSALENPPSVCQAIPATAPMACCEPSKRKPPAEPLATAPQTSPKPTITASPSAACFCAHQAPQGFRLSQTLGTGAFRLETSLQPVLLSIVPVKLSFDDGLRGSRQHPVWLRRILYPDQSALYLEKRSLLL
jgi:hypothetical protein